MEKVPILKRLIDAGYPTAILLILQQVDSVSLINTILWQVGLICCEDESKFGEQFLSRDLIGIMFGIKAKMEPSVWNNNYSELTSMYCYVFNAFTWDYGGTMAEEEKYFERLKPCIHFLMDVIIHEDNCC